MNRADKIAKKGNTVNSIRVQIRKWACSEKSFTIGLIKREMNKTMKKEERNLLNPIFLNFFTMVIIWKAVLSLEWLYSQFMIAPCVIAVEKNKVIRNIINKINVGKSIEKRITSRNIMDNTNKGTRE